MKNERTKYHLIEFLIFPIGIIPLGTITYWINNLSPSWGIITAISVFLWGIYIQAKLNSFICPNCNQPINGSDGTFWGIAKDRRRLIFIRKKCQNCGHIFGSSSDLKT